MNILNFGSCNIDHVYSVDHIVTPGETEASEGLTLFVGGKGLNQSIAAAKAGAPVYHAGCIGPDGDMLRRALSDSGVDVSNLRTVNAKSGHAIIQVSAKGESAIFLYPGSNEMLTEAFIDNVLDKFSSEDILLLQNEVNMISYIVNKAHERGMMIVLNPSPFNERIREIDLNKITYLILNEVEARLITGREKAEDCLPFLLDKYPHLKVLLTQGKRGSLFRDEEQALFQPAFQVATVDTTAAGDTFTGYFIASILRKRPYGEAMKLAAAAAISVSRKGASPSIPYVGEVRETLRSLKVYNSCKSDAILQQQEQILNYIEGHLADATLGELARMMGYSVVYTGELVKLRTGKPFSDILQEKRCLTAADLLVDSDLSVEEIICRVGYKNQTFFRNIFQATYGKAPLAYRKSMRGAKYDR